MRGNGPKKARGHSDRAKKQGGPRPTPHKKTCGFACAFLVEIRPKKSLHTPVWGDFFGRFHLKNSLAKLLCTEKEQILCGAEARRRRHADAWQDGATKESVQNLPFTAHFSYAESAKAALLGAKGMLCYGSGISLLSKSVLSSIEVRESPNFLMRERSWSSCCVSRTAKRSSALNSPTT